MNSAAGQAKDPEKDEADEPERRPWELTIPDVDDVIVGELAERGEWIVANIQTTSAWPVKSQKVTYRDEALFIIPIMRGHFPAVAMKVPKGKSRAECEKLVMRFISNLAWVQDQGLIVDGLGGGSLPAPMGRDKERGFSICEEFDLSYFPEPANERALLALALMREGRGLNHPAYAFLSFFRVLEVAFQNGSDRAAWVAANVAAVKGFRVREALAELAKKGITDIGKHLFESGRSAVAHANRTPIVDPDDPADMRRMSSELPIMKALAEKAIEERLGVETSHTVWRKHLYELAGFKEVLGADTVEHLVRGELITDQRMVNMPSINVRIRNRDPYEPLSNLVVKEIGQNGSVFHACYESATGDVTFRFRLDFAAERLDFSVFDDIAVRDTGSAESALRVAEVRRFEHEFFGNGQLQIFDTETGALISRKDAFIPMNMFLNKAAADAEVARWKALAQTRSERSQRYADEMVRLSMPYAVTFSSR